MRIARTTALLTIGALFAASCATAPSAVLGQQSAGDGWRMTGSASASSAAADASAVEYLGASADGKIVVRRGGRVEIWSR